MKNDLKKHNSLILPTPQELKRISVSDKRAAVAKIIDIVGGLFQYNTKEWIKTGGNLISAWLSNDLGGEARFQMQKLLETGKSKKEAYETREGWTNISDVFGYLYSDKAPNAVVFNALKAIQISTTESTPSETELLKANSFIRIVKSLNPDDIRVMFAAYELYKKYKKGESSKISTFQDWYIAISDMVNLPIDSVVDTRMKYDSAVNGFAGTSLFGLSEPSSSTVGMPNAGLNALSIGICEMVEKGNEMLLSIDVEEEK
ncbi:MAG: hypothetical protein HYW62_02665 [Candidatus Levybacteria bacterium]|nr:hypothetical protein [Candidatus Levybacteria bacterium]